MSDLCDTVHAFADGELPAEEADAFRVHLATCTRCQAELADIMHLTAGGATLAPAAAPPAPVSLAWYRSSRTMAAILIPLAAAVLAVVFIPGDRPALPEYSMNGPTGFVEHTRGSTTTASGAVYLPESMLSLKLLPAQEVSGTQPVAGLFVAREGGALARIRDVELRSTDQGSFAVRANARVLFGETAGSKIIYAVVAPSERDLSSLEGTDPRTLKNNRALRVFSAPVEYRTAP